jgi:hypothetical protein
MPKKPIRYGLTNVKDWEGKITFRPDAECNYILSRIIENEPEVSSSRGDTSVSAIIRHAITLYGRYLYGFTFTPPARGEQGS